MIDTLAFYSITTLMIVSALAVITARQPISAVLALVTTLCAMAGLFVLLGAFFVATIQVLIYAGAIMVLFLFVVMLLDLSPDTRRRTRQHTSRALGVLLGLLFLATLTRALRTIPPTRFSAPPPTPHGTTREIGTALFTTFALPFEVSSVLVLIGIIGAVVLAKRTWE